MDITQFEREIEKTGFVLEFLVSQVLQQHGWTVINNKYYVDDVQNAVREIDIVAYKVGAIRDFHVYTTLIVSCKKTSNDAWVLLAKDLDPEDPNIQWVPVNVWTNDKILTYMTRQSDWRDIYCQQLAASPCCNLVQLPEKHIFAFQEMNKESARPNNDKNIFGSITSLIKAQAYELDVLPKRKHNPVIYQFNLLSIIDGELIRIDFDSAKRSSHLKDDDFYLANYIVNKAPISARIHFVSFKAFKVVLGQYDSLHEANCLSFDGLCDLYYRDSVMKYEKSQIFLDELRKELHISIWIRLKRLFDIDISEADLNLNWISKENILHLEFTSITAEQADALNSDDQLRVKTAQVLFKYYHYSGPFKYVFNDLPF